jgi:very-short-patch-repair endonuclease
MNIGNSDYPLHLGAGKGAFKKARELRAEMTRAESILWNALRNNKIKGYKFRRQHPIGRYIADFYCHKAKLIIEVDGGVHNDPEVKEYDEWRTSDIEQHFIKVIRFSNNEVINNIETVLGQIESELKCRSIAAQAPLL